MSRRLDKGTGGHGKRRLRGKGPTPPAQLRPGHPAAKHAAAEETRARERRKPPAARADEVVAGRNAVLEALRAGVPASVLYLAQQLDPDDRVREAIKLAADGGVSVLHTARRELDQLTAGSVHQGLALKIRPYRYAHADDLVDRAAEAGEPPLIMALDGVTDPHNLGAVARSLAAFGGHGLVVPARRSARVTAGAWKASAGTLARVPVAQVPNLPGALAGYQRSGLFVVGLHAAGTTDIDSLELAAEPLVVVVGSESRGLSRLVRESCDVLVRIPISAAAESLNAGVAAGIALYELAKRRSR